MLTTTMAASTLSTRHDASLSRSLVGDMPELRTEGDERVSYLLLQGDARHIPLGGL